MPALPSAWPLLTLIPAGLGLTLLWRILSSWLARRRAERRLFRTHRGEHEPQAATDSPDELWSSWLERWLYVSGFRSPSAVTRLLFAQALALLIGAAATSLVLASGLVATGRGWLHDVPGGIGDLMAPIVSAGPTVLFLMLALVPVTRVRARRRAIVMSIEKDLPIALALLATLVESGLGFDAASERVTSALEPQRPLARELLHFRSETQAGISRHACFRRLSRRVDVPAMSVFVSAMVHSEQVGGGIAESLRRQADEVWNRRKAQAIQRAQTLPTKLAIPLVICFLPGIFVYTLGPALAEFFRIAEGVVRG